MAPTANSAPPPLHPALAGITVIERGWLSSNNIVIDAAAGEPGAVLVDASHLNHAAQTVSLVRHALRGQRLERLINTHLHSDHCGGNAALQRAFGVPVTVPLGVAHAVRAGDLQGQGHDDFGRREPFEAQGVIAAGESFVAGGRRWRAIASPGHDPHSLMFFDAEGGVLISADALWQNGFGVVFPELVGEPGFGDVAAVLQAIARLPVRVVIPGHGAPFTDLAGALARAQARLAVFRADPSRHTRHGVKVLLKYHLMEESSLPLPELLRWVGAVPMLVPLWQRHGAQDSDTPEAWCEGFVRELAAAGALAIEDGVVRDL